MKTTDAPLVPLKLSDICEIYRVKLTTLNGWIDDGVCQKVQHRFNDRGREMGVLMPDQIDRLRRFQRYRECLSCDIPTLINLLDLEDEGDLESAKCQLQEQEQAVEDTLTLIRAEIMRMDAILLGDEAIDPEDVD